MKPEVALKIEYDIFKKYTRTQVETTRDEWVAAYREIAEKDSSKKELCDSFIERIHRAADLFLSRYVEPQKSDAISHDDSYYAHSAAWDPSGLPACRQSSRPESRTARHGYPIS